ncbi:MAG: hypothetical protein JJT78_02690 [Leptospira sp.]|nr:hypothetical protein [Leptospira sp.]
MILVGVLCFVYVSMAPTEGASQPSKMESRQNFQEPGRRRGKLSEEDLKESLYYARKRPGNIDSDMEERILHEREFSSSYPASTQSHPSDNIVFTQPSPIEQKPEIVESVTILGSDGKNVEPAPEERLIVKGLLFLDTKGRLPLENRDFSSIELTEDAFTDLRRIGEGALFEESGKLIFRVKNLSYTYEPRDLKQVVFYDEAVVFLPVRPDYSSVIFFTDNTDEIRAFFAQAESIA